MTQNHLGQPLSLSPLQIRLLDYMKLKGNITPQLAKLDLGINSGAFTARITELEQKGYEIIRDRIRHCVTGKPYTRYSLA